MTVYICMWNADLFYLFLAVMKETYTTVFAGTLSLCIAPPPKLFSRVVTRQDLEVLPSFDTYHDRSRWIMMMVVVMRMAVLVVVMVTMMIVDDCCLFTQRHEWQLTCSEPRTKIFNAETIKAERKEEVCHSCLCHLHIRGGSRLK